MRRIKPLLILAVIVAIISLGFLGNNEDNNQIDEAEKEERNERIGELAGLSTEDDEIFSEKPLPERKDNRASQVIEKPAAVEEKVPQEDYRDTHVSQVVPQNNRKLNNTNVIFLWTDRQNLKAVNVMSINEDSTKGAVLAVPLHAKIEQPYSSFIEEGKAFTTVGELFYVKGETGLISFIEESMCIEIDSYVLIDQTSFETISDIMGAINIQGEMVYIADAFEQTRSGERIDEQPVVDAVVKAVISPSTLIKVPRMIWVITREVDTNLGRNQIMAIYRQTRNTANIKKRALPGEEYIVDNKMVRDVPEYAWKNLLWELTR